MKSTGIVRPIDSVGRFVIPMEIRRKLNITDAEDFLEIFIDEDNIILRKYSPSCLFCRSSEDIIEFSGKKICKSCIAKLITESSSETE